MNRSSLSVFGVVLAVLSALFINTLGYEPDPTEGRAYTDPTIWVTSTSRGLIHPVDATLGSAGPPIALSGPLGAELDTVQAGSDAYVVDRENGSIRFVDASRREIGTPVSMDKAGPITLYVGGEVGWVYAAKPSGLLQRIQLGPNIRPLTGEIPLGADGDDAVMESSGDILVPDQDDGLIKRVTLNGQVIPSEQIAALGSDLAVRLVDDRPVVLDRGDRILHILSLDLQIDRECPVETTGTPIPFNGSSSDSRFAVLSPEQARVVEVDIDTCQPISVSVGTPGDEFADPIVVDQRLYIPNLTTNEVLIVGLGRSFDEPPSITVAEVPVDHGFELVADGGLVVFNNKAGDSAGSISARGEVREAQKLATRDGDGPGVVVDGVSPETTDTATSPDPSDTEPEPQLQIVCEPRPNPAEVGQTVEYRARVIDVATGVAIEATSFEFSASNGATVSNEEGEFSTTAEQNLTVSITAELAGGSLVPGPIQCGRLDVRWQDNPGDNEPTGPPDEGAASVSCRAEVEEAGIDQEVAFFANLPPTTERVVWTFEPGETKNDFQPTFAFSTPGGKTVTLEVTLSSGEELPAGSCMLSVVGGAPSLAPEFEYQPATVFAGEPVTFTSTTRGAVARFEWELQGASPSEAAGAQPTGIVWNEPGEWLVTLTAYNEDGEPFRATKNIQVLPPRPVSPAPEVTVEPPTGAVTAGQELVFTSAVNKQMAEYEWELRYSPAIGQSRIVDIGETDSPVARYAVPLDQPGVYTASLVVRDDQNRINTDSRSVRVTPAPLDLTIAPSGTRVQTGQLVEFSVQGDVPPDVTWVWTFGDTSEVKTEPPVVGYTFNTPGTFEVTVLVTTTDGREGFDAETITVEDGGTTQSSTIRGTVTIFDTGLPPSDGLVFVEGLNTAGVVDCTNLFCDSASFAGDGSFSFSSLPSGTYRVMARALPADGFFDSPTQTVNVAPGQEEVINLTFLQIGVGIGEGSFVISASTHDGDSTPPYRTGVNEGPVITVFVGQILGGAVTLSTISGPCAPMTGSPPGGELDFSAMYFTNTLGRCVIEATQVETATHTAAQPQSITVDIVHSARQPAAVGMTSEEAQAAVTAALLVPVIEETELLAGDPQIGRVVDVSPQPGTLLLEGASVRIVVGVAPTTEGGDP